MIILIFNLLVFYVYLYYSIFGEIIIFFFEGSEIIIVKTKMSCASVLCIPLYLLLGCSSMIAQINTNMTEMSLGLV